MHDDSSLEASNHYYSSSPAKKRTPYMLLAGISIPLLIIFTLMLSPLLLILSGTDNILAGSDSDSLVFGALTLTFLSETAVILTLWKLTGKQFSSLFKVSKPSLKSTLTSIAVGIIAIIGLQIAGIITHLLGEELSSSDTSIALASSTGWQKWLLLLVFTPIIAPIVEEFLFRGIIYNFMNRGLLQDGKKKSTAFWVPLALSSILFGLMHFQGFTLTGIVVLIWSTLFGAIAVWLYRKYNTIWAPIIAHITYNGLSSALILITTL